MSFKVSCENVADSMRKHAETLTAHLRLAQDEVKARSVMLAHTEEQAAFQRQQHLLERKELEDEYAKQAWQADKNELKIQEIDGRKQQYCGRNRESNCKVSRERSQSGGKS